MVPLTEISAETIVNSSLERIWKYWTEPKHIMKWNNISEDWHTPKVQNELSVGGKLFFRMETKDGTEGFDHTGTYDNIQIHEKISYTTGDGRKATIFFFNTEQGVRLLEVFEIPGTDDPQFHQSFCQAILNNFKTYVENEVNSCSNE